MTPAMTLAHMTQLIMPQHANSLGITFGGQVGGARSTPLAAALRGGGGQRTFWLSAARARALLQPWGPSKQSTAVHACSGDCGVGNGVRTGRLRPSLHAPRRTRAPGVTTLLEGCAPDASPARARAGDALDGAVLVHRGQPHWAQRAPAHRQRRLALLRVAHARRRHHVHQRAGARAPPRGHPATPSRLRLSRVGANRDRAVRERSSREGPALTSTGPQRCLLKRDDTESMLDESFEQRDKAMRSLVGRAAAACLCVPAVLAGGMQHVLPASPRGPCGRRGSPVLCGCSKDRVPLVTWPQGPCWGSGAPERHPPHSGDEGLRAPPAAALAEFLGHKLCTASWRAWDPPTMGAQAAGGSGSSRAAVTSAHPTWRAGDGRVRQQHGGHDQRVRRDERAAGALPLRRRIRDDRVGRPGRQPRPRPLRPAAPVRARPRALRRGHRQARANPSPVQNPYALRGERAHTPAAPHAWRACIVSTSGAVGCARTAASAAWGLRALSCHASPTCRAFVTRRLPLVCTQRSGHLLALLPWAAGLPVCRWGPSCKPAGGRSWGRTTVWGGSGPGLARRAAGHSTMWGCVRRRDDRLAMRRALLANEARRPSLDGTMLRRQVSAQGGRA